MNNPRRPFQGFLYQLIIDQLRHDGYNHAAECISKSSCVAPPPHSVLPSLSSLVRIGLMSPSYDQSLQFSSVSGLNFDAEGPIASEDVEFSTQYLTTHKAAVRTAAISPDGKMIATGSADATLKLLDVSKIHMFYRLRLVSEDLRQEQHPVVKTLYDHSQPVNQVCFHPRSPLLVTCAQDSTIKFFDYSSLKAKKAHKVIHSSVNVRTISVHPAGEHLLVGSDGPEIRIFDLQTSKCFCAVESSDCHKMAVTRVVYSSDGKVFLTGGKEGMICMWDSVSGKKIRELPGAHSGQEVTALSFTSSGRYFLSSGRDGVGRLWDTSMGKEMQIYGSVAFQSHGCPSAITCDESMVVTASEKTNNALLWDARTGESIAELPGHNGNLRWIASSPTEVGFFTCSSDHRGRYWCLSSAM